MEHQHTAIDGSTVTIDAAVDPQRQASSVGVYTVDGRWQELTTSYLEFGRDVALDLGVELTESYRYQGGALLVGTTSVAFAREGGQPPQNDLLHLAVWEGREHSVHTHLYNGRAHDLIAVLDRFTLDEHAAGVRLLPRDPGRTRLAREPSVLREVPSVGLLHIRPMTRKVARMVPSWKGASARGGELFVGRRPGSLHMVLAGRRSHTLIMREGEECSKEDLSRVMLLDVDWRTPSS